MKRFSTIAGIVFGVWIILETGWDLAVVILHRVRYGHWGEWEHRYDGADGWEEWCKICRAETPEVGANN